MNLKMSQILELQPFFGKIKDIKMSLKTAYKLAKLQSKVSDEFKFYQESFQKILDAYAKKDENGNYVLLADATGYEIQEGKERECQTDVINLYNLDIEIDAPKFTLEELDGLELEYKELQGLMPFIEE